VMWTQRLWLRLQTLFHRDGVAQRLDNELQFHLDQQIAENIAAGMTRDEARYAAIRLFGNTTVLKEMTRDTWGWAWIEQIARDLRYACRTLFRSPGFSILTILVIALGIGATVALFTIVHSVLLEPLPFKDPARLIRLYEQSADKSNNSFLWRQLTASGPSPNTYFLSPGCPHHCLRLACLCPDITAARVN
jgi:hypothetical protein